MPNERLEALLADAQEANAALLEAQVEERAALLTGGELYAMAARGHVISARNHAHDAGDRYVLAAIVARSQAESGGGPLAGDKE